MPARGSCARGVELALCALSLTLRPVSPSLVLVLVLGDRPAARPRGYESQVGEARAKRALEEGELLRQLGSPQTAARGSAALEAARLAVTHARTHARTRLGAGGLCSCSFVLDDA